MEVATGSRVLGEVVELSLEEVLRSLRLSLISDPDALGTRTQTHHQPTKLTHMPQLDDITAAHFHATKTAGLSISGRHLPLLYRLISNLISSPHLYAVLVIDIEGRFDATCLTCLSSHLQHVYIHRPARSDKEHTRALVAEAEDILLYGNAARGSAGREWWGTIVVGGMGAGDITADWKGWLRVDRESVHGFALGISAEEALEQRKQRQDAVDAAGWVATSQWGGFTFKEAEKTSGENVDPKGCFGDKDSDEDNRE
ncbi:hypothetical protein F53441_8867 [Fusarium austroafricanum]|uniref:Uncharacterized protein n=1 Tax=Fusarium austroafricanum TaxID=2364996 RepID=A0A8H4KAE2_9HYPO|nr:hypothetical protein F53441_8867 [Fusarium austroafricanum]